MIHTRKRRQDEPNSWEVYIGERLVDHNVPKAEVKRLRRQAERQARRHSR